MLSAANAVWNSFSAHVLPRAAGDRDSSDVRDHGGTYAPSISDALVVKAMLNRAARMPLELVDAIVDFAEYWPHTHTEVDFGSRENGNALVVPPHIRHSRNSDGNNQFLLRTPPLGFLRTPVPPKDAQSTYTMAQPQPWCATDDCEVTDASIDDVCAWLAPGRVPSLEHPCRKIVFTLTSRDQGWANNMRDKGSYRGSYSWFDAGLERYARTPAEQPGDETANQQPLQSPQAARDEGRTDSPSIPPSFALRSIRPAVEGYVVWEAGKGGEKTLAFAHPLLPGPDRIQSNRVATREWTEHTIVWSWADKQPAAAASEAGDSEALQSQEKPLGEIGRGEASGDGSFVRNLRVGDVVTVWAKARFPGWVNMVKQAKVDVYWAV